MKVETKSQAPIHAYLVALSTNLSITCTTGGVHSGGGSVGDCRILIQPSWLLAYLLNK